MVTHPGADLLLGERPPQRLWLGATVHRQEALDELELELELSAVLPPGTVEICPTSGGQFRSGRFTRPLPL
jgi:hypothetical protein